MQDRDAKACGSPTMMTVNYFEHDDDICDAYWELLRYAVAYNSIELIVVRLLSRLVRQLAAWLWARVLVRPPGLGPARL